MAWMRMMGAESVAYHEATVAQPGDDFAGRAMAYYGSRGETPLVWGGSEPSGWAWPVPSRAMHIGRSTARVAPWTL